MSNDKWQIIRKAIKEGYYGEVVRNFHEINVDRAMELMRKHQSPELKLEDITLTRLPV